MPRDTAAAAAYCEGERGGSESLWRRVVRELGPLLLSRRRESDPEIGTARRFQNSHQLFPMAGKVSSRAQMNDIFRFMVERKARLTHHQS